MIIAGSHEYSLEIDYREAFKQEDFTNRFSDILLKYDYIVGDWGYGQLRLKGFYEDHNPKATFDTKISILQDYLYEYCNFGAAYFLLKKGQKIVEKPVVEEAITEDIDSKPVVEQEDSTTEESIK